MRLVHGEGGEVPVDDGGSGSEGEGAAGGGGGEEGSGSEDTTMAGEVCPPGWVKMEAMEAADELFRGVL
jgi:hypothetical protein